MKLSSKRCFRLFWTIYCFLFYIRVFPFNVLSYTKALFDISKIFSIGFQERYIHHLLIVVCGAFKKKGWVWVESRLSTYKLWYYFCWMTFVNVSSKTTSFCNLNFKALELNVVKELFEWWQMLQHTFSSRATEDFLSITIITFKSCCRF